MRALLRPSTLIILACVISATALFVAFVPLQVYKVHNDCQNVSGQNTVTITQTNYHIFKGELTAFRKAKQTEDASCQSATLKLYL